MNDEIAPTGIRGALGSLVDANLKAVYNLGDADYFRCRGNVRARFKITGAFGKAAV